jgi:ubiquinone/menaquinone biosynthesis C-methylase UbiE
MLDRRVHRWFARYWNWQLRSENEAIRAMRQEVAGGARGRVLELGCGTGANFPHYGTGVAFLVASDPNPYMLDLARQNARARGAGVPLVLVRAQAEALPFRDGMFDTVVSTANFCSVLDPARGLAEVRRLLIGGGEYRFFDHVRSDDNRLLGICQDLLTPIHRRLLGTGCHLNRQVGALVNQAGFSSVEMHQRRPLPTVPMALYRPHVLGVARR